MIRTFQALRTRAAWIRRSGADPDIAHLDSRDAGWRQPERVLQMQRDIAEQLAAIPSVTSVAFATALPMETGFANDQPVTAEDKTYAEGIPPLRRAKSVSPGLFMTLGTPLVAGRDFTWNDISANRDVALVSENMAREMWGEPSTALGKRIRIGPRWRVERDCRCGRRRPR